MQSGTPNGVSHLHAARAGVQLGRRGSSLDAGLCLTRLKVASSLPQYGVHGSLSGISEADHLA
jgi:hypothetical protein